MKILITGGAAEPAAVGEFPAVESLHVGIITPDMGHSIFNEDPNAIAAATGVIPHGLDIVRGIAGGPAGAAGWFGAWLIGLVIIVAEMTVRPWSI